MHDKAFHEKAFAAAKEKLELARGKLAEMKRAEHIDQLAKAWGEFLVEQHRVFLRLKKATEQSAGKGWFDRITNEQRTDELLKYLLHARDAAEHGIEPITEKRDGGLTVNPKPGLTELNIKHMTLSSGQSGARIEMDPETAAQVIVKFVPASVHLIPVKDRSTIFNPPKQHLGKAITDISPIAVAELALAYLEQKLAEAEEKYI